MLPASTQTSADGASAVEYCQDECSCVCHKPSSALIPIPPWLNPWIGKLNIPRMVAASLAPWVFPCNDSRCRKSRDNLQVVRYYLPLWFAQVEASIRFEAFPVHFIIQTPRLVPSLRHLKHIGFDEFRVKLSTREITLNDVDQDGYSVLHVSLLLLT